MGLIEPDGGTVRVFGLDPLSHRARLARGLPGTGIFEGMRRMVRGEAVSLERWGEVLALDLIWFAAGLILFCWMFRLARSSGRLVRLGQD